MELRMIYLIHTISVLVIVLGCCDGAKILAIFPTVSFSHQQPMLAISRALAAKGHSLTVITPNPNKPPLENHRDIDVSHLYAGIHKNIEKEIEFSAQERSGAWDMANSYCRFGEVLGPMVLDTPQVQAFIREVNGTKFDLILYEPLFYSGFLGFSELVGNPPMVGILTFSPMSVQDGVFGNPSVPSYRPLSMLPYSDRMSFLERAENFLLVSYFEYLQARYCDPIHEKILKKYFGDVEHTAYELERNVSLLIVTTDLASDYPRPYHSNTIYVGPTHIEKPKPLPQDIQKWMDGAEDGVIYFSLGSNMQGTSVPEAKRSAFIRAFSQFPRVRVLWKWESDDKMPGQPDNVLVKKWLPQQSILVHPKMRVFISQVGLQSMGESITHGVPILGVPMFGDQDFNAIKLEKAGAGRRIEFADITYETVYENLKQLLTNSSYKENMMRLSKITKDKPMPAIETSVWWIEYVLRHQGAPHLRPAAIDLTWYQYYCFDVMAVLFVAFFGSVYLIYFVLRKAFCSVTCKNKLKTN